MARASRTGEPLVACMRKLLTILDVMVRTRTRWMMQAAVPALVGT